MIEFLRGKVVHIEPEYVVIDVGGVGYRVFCANPYAFQATPGGETTVHVHQHVREGAIQLFGFATRDELALFRLLLDVTGIGPKVALGVLAGGTPEQVIRAIGEEDVGFLTRLPGIGRKTAQRMILDLKDKLGRFGTLPFGEAAVGAIGAGVAAPAGASAGAGSAVWAEAREALLALGITPAETEKAYQRIKDEAGPDAPADVWVKLALQVLYRG